MEEDCFCRDCRKWEEDMYWNHFQSILFFQFLSAGFNQQLVLPKKFANNLREKLPDNVTLKGPSGAKWNVELLKSGSTVIFKKGWKTFVEDHSLKEDDVLVFKYNGDLQFDVLIFDGRSFCEREASYFVRKCGHKQVDGGGYQTKRNTRESSREVMHDCSHYALRSTGSKRSRKDGNLMQGQPEQYSQANGSVANGTNHAKFHCAKWDMRSREPVSYASEQNSSSDDKRASIAMYPVQYMSNRRLVTEEEKDNALQMAHAASTKYSVLVVMRPSHVYKGFYMSIPSEWVISHLPHKSQDVTLRLKENNSSISDKTWQARFYYRVYGGGLTGGWKNFAVENNLEEFDVCLFELVSRTNDALVMDVAVFRVVKEISPLTRLASPSARRGKRSKHSRRKSN
ncbi:hypothetical protein NMG60_11024289 [Bertholletia excelsa]